MARTITAIAAEGKLQRLLMAARSDSRLLCRVVLVFRARVTSRASAKWTPASSLVKTRDSLVSADHV